MTLYKHRDKFKIISIKIGMVFSKLPFSPNQWTVFSVVPAIFGLVSVYYGNVYAAVILFALTAFIDIIDGSVARILGRVTNLGAYLDTIIDRYIEAIMILSIFFLGLPDFYIPISLWLLALLFGSMMSTYAKASSSEKRIVELEGGHGIKGGILEHTDRLVLLFIVFLASIFAPLVYVTYIVVLMAVLSNVSSIQRIYYAYSIARRNK